MPQPAAPTAVVPCAVCRTPNRIDLTKLSHGPKCADCHRPISLNRPFQSSDSDFDRILVGTTVPVLVDFYADWCGPCKAMAPVIDQFAHRQHGRVIVLKLDSDADQATAGRFGIRGIPTLIVFQGGREVQRHVGMADLAALERLAAVPPH